MKRGQCLHYYSVMIYDVLYTGLQIKNNNMLQVYVQKNQNERCFFSRESIYALV